MRPRADLDAVGLRAGLVVKILRIFRESKIQSQELNGQLQQVWNALEKYKLPYSLPGKRNSFAARWTKALDATLECITAKESLEQLKNRMKSECNSCKSPLIHWLAPHHEHEWAKVQSLFGESRKCLGSMLYICHFNYSVPKLRTHMISNLDCLFEQTRHWEPSVIKGVVPSLLDMLERFLQSIDLEEDRRGSLDLKLHSTPVILDKIDGAVERFIQWVHNHRS